MAEPLHMPTETTDLPALGSMLREWIQATEALQSTHETLQAEVHRLRHELADKDRELQRRQRLASLGELAAGVAHEVRNPLGAIRLYSQLLRQNCDDHPALELIDKIQAGISAIDGVVQDTLALAPRAVAGLPCPVAELLQGARDLCLTNLRHHEVRLRVEQRDPEACVAGDRAALQRVLVNLINNAAEASPPGTTVRVQVARTGDGDTRIAIADEGCGFAADVLERIFDPFYTTKQTGTGLGLTIAHRLIEAHGGCLRASNRSDGGALLEVVLPTSSAREETAPRPSADQTNAA